MESTQDMGDRRFLILVRHGERERRHGRPEAEHRLARPGSEAGSSAASPLFVAVDGLRRGSTPAEWEARAPDGAPAAAVDEVSDFASGGAALVHALAGSLADALLAEGVEAVERVVHSEHAAARETAEIYRGVLEKRLGAGVRLRGCRHLTPPHRGRLRRRPSWYAALQRAKRADGTNEFYAGRLVNALRPKRSNAAVVVVAHQPQLTWLAREATEGRLSTGGLPIGAAEAACVRLATLTHRPRLLWLLTQDRPEVAQELREKVRAKYDVAKFLLGAFVVNAGLVLNTDVFRIATDGGPAHEPGDQAVSVLGLLSLLLALGFTVATLFGYDALLMPRRFWGSDAEGAGEHDPKPWSVARPPSSSQVKLYCEMVHVWTSFFVPSIVFAAAALICFLFVVVRESYRLPFAGTLVGFLVAATVAFGIPFAVYRDRGPSLGVDD